MFTVFMFVAFLYIARWAFQNAMKIAGIDLRELFGINKDKTEE